MNRANLLWIDWHLEPLEKWVTIWRSHLQPILRFLKQTPEIIEWLCLLEAQDLETFVKFLDERKDLSPSDPDYIDALLLPKVWRQWETLKALWMPNELILPFDVPFQIDNVIKTSKDFESYKDRPSWYLDSYTWDDVPKKCITLLNWWERILGTNHIIENRHVRSVHFWNWISEIIKSKTN